MSEGRFREPREAAGNPPPNRTSSLHAPSGVQAPMGGRVPAPNPPQPGKSTTFGTPHQRGIEVAGSDAPRSAALDPRNIGVPEIPPDLEQSVFYPVTSLPSGGISYPPGATISYRPYVFGEIKLASARGSQKFGVMAETLVKGIKTNFPVTDLTFYDFLYIALLRKLSTIQDTKIQVTHTCRAKDCQAKNVYTIDVSPANCEIEFWELEFKELPISITLANNVDLQFLPLTLGQFLQLEQVGLERDSVALLAMQCTNLSFEEARRTIYWASTQDPMDGKVLGRVEDILYHGTKPFRVRCATCSEVNLLQLDGGGVIIQPFRPDSETIESRIRFGKEPSHQPDTSGEDGLRRGDDPS
jgi:hypothetical protein